VGLSEELPVKSDKFIQCSALSAQERWRENRGDGGIMGGLFNVSNIFAFFFFSRYVRTFGRSVPGSGMDFQFFRRIVRTRQLKNNNNKTNSLRIDCLQVFFKNPCVVTYL